MFGVGGGSSGGQPQGSINPSQIDMAVTELDMITDVFNRIVSSVPSVLRTSIHAAALLTSVLCCCRSCHSKCVSTRYAEPDLNKGESVCIDRCVGKYFGMNISFSMRRHLEIKFTLSLQR